MTVDHEKEAMRRTLQYLFQSCDKQILIDRVLYLEEECSRLISERGKPCT